MNSKPASPEYKVKRIAAAGLLEGRFGDSNLSYILKKRTISIIKYSRPASRNCIRDLPVGSIFGTANRKCIWDQSCQQELYSGPATAASRNCIQDLPVGIVFETCQQELYSVPASRKCIRDLPVGIAIINKFRDLVRGIDLGGSEAPRTESRQKNVSDSTGYVSGDSALFFRKRNENKQDCKKSLMEKHKY